MGQSVGQENYSADDYQKFAAQLHKDLDALEVVLARPDFGAGETTIGAELELNLIDAAAQPLMCNLEVLAAAGDPRVTLELDRFNLEINASPLPLRGSPFTKLGAELTEVLTRLGGVTQKFGGRIVMIGILPTLCAEHLQAEAVTQTARFRALMDAERRLWQGSFRLRIDGEDPLALDLDEPAFEGAATSLQVHLRVAASDFADTYNAAQLAIAPVLACAGNSPLFLGHRLWAETRIALFRNTPKECHGASELAWRPGRFSFGQGWVRRSALELFAASARLYEPLLPVASAELDPVAVARAGKVPMLHALRVHHGSVWPWNRAVYDPHGAGHLRIELRSLPAGPTVADMLANAAFALGLTLALTPRINQLLQALTFGQARRNFYAAARDGLAAELLWPSDATPSPQPMAAAALIEQLLPAARLGLLTAGVAAAEADALLGIIAARVHSGQTGAAWQRRTLEALTRKLPRPQALTALLTRYQAYASTGAPVHSWPCGEP